MSLSSMENEVNKYLQALFTVDETSLNTEDLKASQRDKSAFLVNKFSLKKFRRRKLGTQTAESMAKKVAMSIAEDRPLHFTVPFGGYKHFWNPSHPEPDWAELFNFRYLTEYVAPALVVHKPGVIIEYMSEDLILPRMNNYPPDALESYSKTFRKLIDWYNERTPDNLEFRFFRVGDRVDKHKVIQQVESLLPERRKHFEALSQEAKDRELHRSVRSVFWNGDKDLTGLSEKEQVERMIESRLIELAYYETEAKPEFIGNYLGEDNHICICFSYGTTHDNDQSLDLTLGTTHGSIVDHWIGRGVFLKQENGFTPRIVSRQQYESSKGKLTSVPVHNFLPFKNYQTIEVISAGL